MTKNKILKSIIIVAFSILLILLLRHISLAKVNLTVTQEKREPAKIKITSDENFAEVKIYRKISSGKYILIYKALPENTKSFESSIPIHNFSTDDKTDFKVIVKDKDGKVVGEESATIKPIPSAVPMNPSETAKPTTTASAVPTKPTPSTTPSSTSSQTPSQTPSTTPSPSSSEPTGTDPQPKTSNEVCKVLIIGNSYTFYNDLGGILAELGQKTGKKMVVVEATHGGYVPDQFAKDPISGYYWDNRESKTKVVLNGGKALNYNTTLQKVFKKDWADLNRPGKWDYIFFQNYVSNENKIAEGDTKIYNIVKSGLENPKNFIIIGTYYKSTDGKSRIASHAAAARKNGTSVMDIADIMDGYGSDWRKECTILDGPKHPTATQQYLVATGMYARIFGKEELAKTKDDTNFIKLYNEKGKKLRDKIASTDRNDSSKGQTSTCNSVTMAKAKKIQALIYKNYEKYILFDVRLNAPLFINQNSKATLVRQEVHTTIDLTPIIKPLSVQNVVSCSTSNKKVVTFTGPGRIYAVSTGYATITLKTANGKESKYTVRVEENGITKNAVKDIEPYDTIQMKINNNSKWKVGQGAARIKVDGKWYMVCAVIQTKDNPNRNSQNTMIYIVEESSKKTVAKIRDYCFEHCNVGTSDGNYIYLGNKSTIWRLSKDYVSDAIKRYKSNGNKIITNNFTKNYVKKFSLNDGAGSLAYDSVHKKFYCTTNYAIYKVTLSGNSGTRTKIANLPHIKEELGNDKYVGTNSGLAIYGDYILISRYLNKKIDGETKNIINVYKCSFDEKGEIESINYKNTIIFNKSPMSYHEIESLQSVGNGKFVVYYNSPKNSTHSNNIYYFDASKAFN